MSLEQKLNEFSYREIINIAKPIIGRFGFDPHRDERTRLKTDLVRFVLANCDNRKVAAAIGFTEGGSFEGVPAPKGSDGSGVPAKGVEGKPQDGDASGADGGESEKDGEGKQGKGQQDKKDGQKKQQQSEGGGQQEQITEERVREIAREEDALAPVNANVQKAIKDAIKILPPRLVKIEIKKNDQAFTLPGHQHPAFASVLRKLQAGLNVCLVGPAGSGKTTLAEHCATALDLPYYFTGAVDSPYKLSGFVDANGRIVSTQFRKAYTDGGLFLFDEIDGSNPGAVLAFNAALANGYADFPGAEGPTKRHPNFRCIAASNTFWNGADRVYVGRYQLDAASIDRFAFIEMDYDANWELEIGGEWAVTVQKYRATARKLGERIVISTRAIISGKKLLEAGENQKEVEMSVIFRGTHPDTVEKIRAGA